MVKRRISLGLAITNILAFGILLVSSAPQAMAESLNYKFLSHVTKGEAFPIPDAEAHYVGFNVRFSAMLFDNGEMAWNRTIVLYDRAKGEGNLDQYGTIHFQDGSTIITRTKGTTQAAGTSGKVIGEIIHGTGRFQGIKGTTTIPLIKFFPLEKGETGAKSFGEGILIYTLPSK
jgi:hypothetical protein